MSSTLVTQHTNVSLTLVTQQNITFLYYSIYHITSIAMLHFGNNNYFTFNRNNVVLGILLYSNKNINAHHCVCTYRGNRVKLTAGQHMYTNINLEFPMFSHLHLSSEATLSMGNDGFLKIFLS